MDRRTAAVAASSLLLLGGCASTDPGRGADITYYLPKTDVSAKLTLTLTDCDDGGLVVEVEPALAAEAGVQDRPVHIDSRRLTSARIARGLKISTGEDLVLTGVNAQATDQTAAIVSNGLKILTGLVGTAPAAAIAGVRNNTALQAESLCKPDVWNATVRARLLKARIAELRGALVAAKPIQDGKDQKLAKELNSRAIELAALQTGILQVVTVGEIAPTVAVLKSEERGVVHFKPKAFDKWLKSTPKPVEVDRKFGLVWSAKLEMPEPIEALTSGKLPSRDCGLSIPVPAPLTIAFSVEGDAKDAAGRPVGELLKGVAKSASFPLAQLTPNNALCLDAGFGEKRGIEVAFDKFGRTTSIDWSSDATAANVSEAIAGYVPTVRSFRAKTPEAQPGLLEQQKAEIDRLKTLKEYNELKSCAAIYEAGGVDCKSSASE